MTSKDRLSTSQCRLLRPSKSGFKQLFICSLVVTPLLSILYPVPLTIQIENKTQYWIEISSSLLAQTNQEDLLVFKTNNYAVRIYLQASKLYMNIYNKKTKKTYKSVAESSDLWRAGEQWKIYISNNKEYEVRFSQNSEAELQIVRNDGTKITEPGNNIQSKITFPTSFVDPILKPLQNWLASNPVNIPIFGAIIAILGGFLAVVVWPFFKNRGGDIWDNTITFITGKRFENRYLESVIKEYHYLPNLPTTLVPVTEGKSQELDKIYVSLAVVEGNQREEEISLENALYSHPYLIILGDPGAGKTTMLRFLTLTFAKARRGRPSPAKRKEMKIEIPSFQEARKRVKNSFRYQNYPLPVVFYLSKFQDIMEWEADRSLLDALRDELKSRDVLRDFPEKFFSEKLEHGECIFLFDAFDELAKPDARNKVAELIGKLALDAPQGNRFVVTSRIVGYDGQLQQYRFHPLTVQNLSWNLISDLIQKWYASLDAPELVEPLLKTLREKPRIYELAINPMLLSLIALVQYVRRIIPDQRHILYDECVKILIDRRYAPPHVQEQYNQTLPAEEAIRILRELAIKMHREGMREVPRDALEQSFIPDVLTSMPTSKAATVPPKILLKNIEQRSQLLVERGLNDKGQPVMAFSHLTFQEYLASVALKESTGQRGEATVSDELIKAYETNPGQWEEVALLYAAQLDSPQQKGFINRLHPEEIGVENDDQ